MNQKDVFQITFINVGNGDSILIESPDVRCPGGRFVMLIDGGSGEPQEYDGSTTGRIRAVEYLEQAGVDHIDWMISTHIHEDHTCGLLEAARRFPPAVLFQPFPADLYQNMRPLEIRQEDRESLRKFTAALNAYQCLCRLVTERGGRVRQLAAGETLPVCGAAPSDWLLQVLGPERSRLEDQMEHLRRLYSGSGREELPILDKAMNGVSLCVMLQRAGRRILLTGDTELAGYPAERSGLKADIFKVGHHGQRGSLDEELVRAIAPQWAVVCASSDRRYESAAPEVLQVLRQAGVQTFFTDCPQVLPYTEGLQPHRSVRFQIEENGKVRAEYEN